MQLRICYFCCVVIASLVLDLLVEAVDISTTLNPYIYTHLNNWPCVRLLNATGTIGCHGANKKSGVLYQVDTIEELDHFTSHKHSENYALIIPYSLVTPTTVNTLSGVDSITGLIVIIDNSTHQSPDASCPNCEFGLYANDAQQYVWNPSAYNLIEQDFKFPIFAIRPGNIMSNSVYDKIIASIQFNREREYKHYPLRSIDFELFMWAAVDAETCLRRNWCQVIGGLSVYSTPSLDIEYNDKKPIIVVSASADSRSMFHDLTVGLSKDISGLVTLLTIADALSKSPVPLNELPKHILYTSFSGESWGFAGSQRFVKDISSPFQCINATRAKECPYKNAPCSLPCVRDLHFKRINFDNIESIFEFQSVSGISSNYRNGYYAHVDNIENTQSIVSSLQTYSNVQPASSDNMHRKLPPSSSMSFLQKRRNIKAVVITDYQDSLGKYYNSDLDDQLDIEQMSTSICGLVDSTAKVIYGEASNGLPSNMITANCTLVAELLDCLVLNFSCPFMQTYFNVSGITNVQHYASVLSFSNPQPQLLQRFAFSYFSGVTGKPRIDSAGAAVECQTIKDCQSNEYCVNRKCISTLTTYHEAYGTGLQYDESTGRVMVVDKTKATWTESTWNNPSFRLYLTVSKTHQIVILIAGILWLVVSVITVIYAKKYLRKALKRE